MRTRFAAAMLLVLTTACAPATPEEAEPLDNLPPAVRASVPDLFPIDQTLRVDLTRSFDPDGVITHFRCAWGDGSDRVDAPGGICAHSYTVEGRFTLAIELEDDRGATAAQQYELTVSELLPAENCTPACADVAHCECLDRGDCHPCPNGRECKEIPTSNPGWTLCYTID